MKHESTEAMWPWRDHLRGNEAAFIAADDACRGAVSDASDERAKIINRAIQRAKRAALKKEKLNAQRSR